MAQGHDYIDIPVLEQYPEFVEFRTTRNNETTGGPQHEVSSQETPEETLQTAYEGIRSDLASELLDRIKTNSPVFFERLVVDLMMALGYGGTRSGSGEAIGRSGDEGIDGIINEDRLGLDVIYIQAKRWEDPVGRPEVQKFVGALHGQRARKGVFITTSRFTPDAEAYVATIDPKVILISGRRLAELMIDADLGVSTSVSYHVKKVDSDYFEED